MKDSVSPSWLCVTVDFDQPCNQKTINGESSDKTQMRVEKQRLPCWTEVHISKALALQWSHVVVVRTDSKEGAKDLMP